MRFPHRVRFHDPRNRQPPEGVAYNAVNYDLIRQTGENRDKTIAELNANNAEPKDVSYPTFDVPALVSMTDDGNRDKNETAYSIRIPLKSFNDIKIHFENERRRSLDNFGYSVDLPDPLFSLREGSNNPLTLAARRAIASANLTTRVSIRTLTISPDPKFPNPFTDRIIPGLYYYRADFNVIEGVIPPMRMFSDSESEEFSSYLTGPNAYVNLGPGYFAFLPIRRVDTFLDMVDFRCIEPLPYL